MKKLSLLLGLMAMMAGVYAGPVDQQKAQQLGTRFMNTTVLAQRGVDIQLNPVAAAADLERGGVDYYVFNVRGGNGFVIVSGDDRVKPILAYSTTGAFEPENVSEGFQYMLNGYREEIQYVRSHNLKATPDIVAEWEAVLSNGQLNPGRHARSVVGPLCQTIWNQNFPYNSQCPEDPEGNGGYVYAGCVATAMGQVMKFWDYPERGTGSHTYNPDGYAQQTANFGNTDYHFELMPLALDSTSTEEDYFYIAQFLHHCGIAVDMQYSGNGSGAYSDDVPPALRNYFDYTCDDHNTNYNFWPGMGYSNEEWGQMLKNGGLDEGLPLYYSGSDDNMQGGHAFVCDGYDENDYFHFNWGWSGRDDAWCPIGALNTTKYAFNLMNGFTGHIIPQNSDYYMRADSVADFTVTENRDFTGVTLSWTNPSVNLNGDPLSSIESISIRRNNQELVTLTDAQVGADMSYEDNNLEPGLYEYGINVTNTSGISRMVYRTVLVGEKCPITFVLQDEGGDGWKGAAISVATENGQRIAVVTMEEGDEKTVTVPLLKQNLNFIWNHGWYHTNEQYDTDFECSFSILDGEGQELFVSSELEDGVFMTYLNNCEEAPLTCYPVENLQGEYQWNNEGFGALLSWERPDITFRLSYFQIMKTDPFGWTNVVEVLPYTGDVYYEYFDTITSTYIGENVYTVVSIYLLGDDVCASESERLTIMITGMDSFEKESISVYPNPTTGMITIENQGSMRIVVSNLLGQKLIETVAEDNISVDLGSFGRGVYLLRVETANGTAVQKVSVQ